LIASSKHKHAALEHQVKFSNLHEKQAEVIAKTYALTRKFNSDLQEYLEIPDIAEGKTRNEREKEVVKSHRNFIDFFQQHQIYLSKNSVELLQKIDLKLKNNFHEFYYIIKQDPSTQENATRWIELHKSVKEDFEGLFQELDLEFRRILGNR